MGNFTFIKTGIDGLTVIEPSVFGDERGFFMETYHADAFSKGGIDAVFVQDNHSKSRKGVLRGMHFQVNNPQGKLVRVIDGEVYDVAVDIRKGSRTFGNWYGVALSSENKRQLYVPEGFAHGFYVVSPTAEFVYKCTRFYDPTDELGIRYDDSSVGIDWPVSPKDIPVVSKKDQELPGFEKVCEMLNLK